LTDFYYQNDTERDAGANALGSIVGVLQQFALLCGTLSIPLNPPCKKSEASSGFPHGTKSEASFGLPLLKGDGRGI